MSDERTCKVCGKVLVLRANEANNMFLRRVTCGRACSSALRLQNMPLKDPLPARYCEYCGAALVIKEKEYPSRYLRRKCCDHVCSGRLHSKERMSSFEGRVCANPECENILVRRENEQAASFCKRITCSKRCGAKVGWNNIRENQSRSLQYSRISLRDCVGCGQTFKPRRREQIYCTHSCASLFIWDERNAIKVSLVCEHCSRPFIIKKSEEISQTGYKKRFCSRKCQSDSRRGTTMRPETICAGCGCIIMPVPKRPTPKYCSQTCAALHRASRFSLTSIERKTYDALDRLGIKFEPQWRLGRFLVDAYVDDMKLVIECQGDFYHCNPRTYPDGPKGEIQTKTVLRDKRRVSWLVDHGYSVLELWESDIMQHGAEALLRVALDLPEWEAA